MVQREQRQRAFVTAYLPEFLLLIQICEAQSEEQRTKCSRRWTLSLLLGNNRNKCEFSLKSLQMTAHSERIDVRAQTTRRYIFKGRNSP